jgi:hypothetical protein
MIEFNSKETKAALKKLNNIDVNNPKYPAYKRMITDYCELFNYVLAVITNKENRKKPN